MLDKNLLSILVCPNCKGKLIYQVNKKELICRFDKLAYPIEDDIPIMLVERARQVDLEELTS